MSDDSAPHLTQSDHAAPEWRPSAISGLTDAVFHCDSEGVVLAWNQAAEDLFGYTAHEALTRDITCLIPCARREEFKTKIRVVATGGRVERFELSFIDRGGREVGFSLALARTLDENGEVAGVCGFAHAMPPEHAIHRGGYERSLALAWHSNDLIIVVDDLGRIRYANVSSRRLLGFDLEDHVDRELATFVHCDDWPTVAEVLRANSQTSEVEKSCEFRITTGDGLYRSVEGTCINLFSDPDVGGTVINVRDVTERRQAEERYRQIVETAEEGVWTIDATGVTTFVNRRMAEILGSTPEELIGSNVLDFVNPEDTPNVEDQISGTLAGDRGAIEHTFRRRDGVLVPVLVARSPLLNGDGIIVGGLALVTDITDRKRAQQAVLEREAWLSAIVDNAFDLVVGVTAGGEVTYASPSSQRMLGRSIGREEGSTIFDNIHPDDLPAARKTFAEAISRSGPSEAIQIRIRDAADSYRWIEAVGTNLLEDAAVGAIIIHGRDITASVHAEAKILHEATHDSLTGLPNRALFLDRLDQALGRTERVSTSVGVLFCDLDDFKTLNDSYGHTVGDAVLVEVAKRLGSVLRPGDTLARFGGDEFLVCSERLVGAADAHSVADRLLLALESPVTVENRELFVGASIGIRISQGAPDTAEIMIRDADVAMYQAKQEGRARVAEFNELLRNEIQHRAQLEAHLHQAIANKEFMVYFQPTVSLDTRELVGFEALLRWQHPERGIVMPDEFIPVAEEIGLIIPLGAWVMEEACRQLRTWQDAGAPHLTMAINLSVRQLTAPGLVGEVSAIFKRTGVSAEDICLEVTESELMHDAEKSVSCLEGLRALGVKLAIDDFGTGYSSLSYLRRFPVDFLKIDRSFVAHLGSESEATAIVTAVVHLAHSLNLKTVAEGVETPDQEMQLKLLGCDVGQGFYWSRPLAAAELGPWFSYSGIPKASKVEEEGHRSPGDRIRVVLADDEMSHRAMVARVLERSGCFTIVGQAPDGHFAIDLAATSQPDLMILDLSMPTMGGLEALPEILSSSPRTKVVLYSGSVTRQSDRRLPSGASAFLGKSLNPDQLIEELLVVMGAAAGD